MSSRALPASQQLGRRRMLGRAKCREKSAEQESWETCPQVAHAFRKFVGSVGKLKLHVQCTAEKGLGIRL